jgi:hypothetical protein
MEIRNIGWILIRREDCCFVLVWRVNVTILHFTSEKRSVR